jgi:hypothetical protein
MTDEQMKAVSAKELGYTVQKREVVSDVVVVLHTTMIGSDQVHKMVVQKVGSDWKIAGPTNNPPLAAASSRFTDLGVVEFSDGGTNQIDVGGGKVCVIKSTINKDQTIALNYHFEQTDASGVKRILAPGGIKIGPKQFFGISDGVKMYRITPHIKL